MVDFNELDRGQQEAIIAKVESHYVFKRVHNIGFALLTVIALLLVGGPQYRVYNQTLKGEALLAEAQSSRRVAVLEARAKMESAKSLAGAEILRASGAAKANHILQNSLGGPEGYLRYLQIQALQDTNAKMIYVPTESGLPITEAGRLMPAPVPVK